MNESLRCKMMKEGYFLKIFVYLSPITQRPMHTSALRNKERERISSSRQDD